MFEAEGCRIDAVAVAVAAAGTGPVGVAEVCPRTEKVEARHRIVVAVQTDPVVGFEELSPPGKLEQGRHIGVVAAAADLAVFAEGSELLRAGDGGEGHRIAAAAAAAVFPQADEVGEGHHIAAVGSGPSVAAEEPSRAGGLERARHIAAAVAVETVLAVTVAESSRAGETEKGRRIGAAGTVPAVIVEESRLAGAVEGVLHIAAAAAAAGVEIDPVASIEGPSQLGELVDASRVVLLGVSGSGVRTGGAAAERVAVGTAELEAVGTRRAPVGTGWPAAGTGRAIVAAAGTGEAAEPGGVAAAEVVAVAGVEVVGSKLMAGPSEWGLGTRPAGREQAVESDTDKGWGFPPGNSAFQVAGQVSGRGISRTMHQTKKHRKKKSRIGRGSWKEEGSGRARHRRPTLAGRRAGVHPIFPRLSSASAFRALLKW